MNYVENRDCEPMTADEVERRRRDHKRAVALDFATVADPPSGYFSATGYACPADKPVSLRVGAMRAIVANEPDGKYVLSGGVIAASAEFFGAIADVDLEPDVVNYAFPPPVPMIDWERAAAAMASDCAVMAKALQKANKEIARLMALLPAEAEAPRSSGDAIAAALRLPTVPGAYGRTP